MTYKFETILKKHEGKDATYIEIPFDVEKEFGSKRVEVKVKFDGYDYRGSIVKMGLPCYMIGVTKEVRKNIGKEAGDTIFVQVEKDNEVREVELPNDFKTRLEDNATALDFYNSLSYSGKRKYYQWISSAKKAKTREKRIEEALKKLEEHIKL